MGFRWIAKKVPESYVHRVGEIDCYCNGYKLDGVTNLSDSLNLLASKISGFVDTPLYPKTIRFRRFSSSALQKVADECYIQGV